MLLDLFRRLARRASPTTTRQDDSALVAVYLRDGRFFIEPNHRTRQAVAGFRVSSGEVDVRSEEASDEELGGAILAALDRCRLEVEPPPRDAKLEEGLFRAMGVRSRRAAMNGTLACHLEREGATLRIRPLHNGGTTGMMRGYSGVPGSQIELSADSEAVDVGAAVRIALERATAVATADVPAGGPRRRGATMDVHAEGPRRRAAAADMMLIDPALAAITFAVGFLARPLDDVAAELERWYREADIDRALQRTEADFREAVLRLVPLGAPFYRRLWIETRSERWPTAYLDGFVNGTDAFPPISELAKRMGSEALIVELRPQSSQSYGARAIALYGPGAADALGRSWSVSAMNDGGRWTWARTGGPLSFEEELAYTERRVADRLTPDRLLRYAAALGAPLDPADFGRRCVEDVPRRTSRDQRSESLAEARARFGIDQA